jgi:death-on-curing protein
VRYLTAEELLAIHQRILLAIGGLEGIRDVGLLYSIAERPKMAMMGREFYQDIFSKAAAYFEGLATYHVFADGNKRTAIAATAVFLRANGYHLKIEEDQGFDFVLAVATKKKTMEEIAGWLKKHCKKR